MDAISLIHESLYGLIFVIFVVSAILLIPAARKFINKHILPLMIITYISGFSLYLWGYWFGASTSMFSVSLRAAISALEMFASKSDLVEVSEELKMENALYMLLFAVTHFVAIILTFTFILDMFGKRLVSRLQMKSLVWGAKDKHLILFDDTNEITASIAKSIPADPKNVIVFVKGIIDPQVKSLSIFDALLKGFNNRTKSDACENLGTVIYAPVSLANALATREGWVYKTTLKLIKKYKSSEIFIASWDSQMNANASYKLSQDLPEGLEAKIYAGVNITKPHTMKLYGSRYVKIVNRSSLVVENLCNTTPLLSEGKGKRTLILGFGYTARRCIQVLTEAGFTQIDTIDPEVGIRSEQFLCNNEKLRSMEGVRFFNYATKSNAYWAYIHENIDSIDNIIVFGQNQDTNYENAYNLINYAMTAKDNIEDLRVYMMENTVQPGDNSELVHSFGKAEDVYHYERLTQSETL